MECVNEMFLGNENSHLMGRDVLQAYILQFILERETVAFVLGANLTPNIYFPKTGFLGDV